MIEEALWHHANAVYAAMKKGSKQVTIDGRKARLWEGFATKLTSELSIPVSYYGKTLKALKLMGAAQCIRRGARGIPSQWVVEDKPTEAAYMKIKDQLKQDTAGRTIVKMETIAAVEQQVSDIKKSLGGLDIPKALADLQGQIDELKNEIQAQV